MPHPPRIIGYDDGDPTQILEHFEADARGAEGHDWYPISQTWTDGVLFVEYEHDPDRRLRAAAKVAARSHERPDILQGLRALASDSHSWVPSVIVVALIVAAVIGVSMVAFSPGEQTSGVTPDPGAQPTPTATAFAAVPLGPSPAALPDPTTRPGSQSSDDPDVATFIDGVWEVGVDVEPGTYRTLGGEGCSWSRLRRLDNRQGDVIAERRLSGPAIATIKRRDMGFDSARCHSWTSDLGRITESRTEFGEGTFLVGTDITPGTYRSRSRTACSWERLRGFTGDKADTIASGVGTGRRSVTIRGSDEGFSSTGCGKWSRVKR